MAIQVLDITCPGCGAPVRTDQQTCEWCQNPIVITSFTSVSSMSPLQLNKYASSYRKELAEHPDNRELNTSIGMCYLKLRMLDEAYASFSKAIVDNFDNSETYFYAALCLLKGRKAFLCSRPEIDKILELMNAATMIEPRGIYYYFMAYIKFDYFKRKFLNTTPNYKDYLAKASAMGCSPTDIGMLFDILGVEKPNMV
jgi:tetratricopeptide (TPR) repeat protein